MFRSRSALLAVAALAAASPLRAQEKPTEAMVKAIAGTWLIDTVRSEQPPAALAALLQQGQRGAAPPPAADAGAATAATSGGGGGRRGGGGGGGRGLGPRQMGGDGNLRVLGSEFRVARKMVLDVAEAKAVTTDLQGYQTTWTLDGKKHQVAQMEGGFVEYRGEWHGKTLVLEKSIPGGGSVKREFKPLGENELEVKIVANVGRKAEQKVVYTRAP